MLVKWATLPDLLNGHFAQERTFSPVRPPSTRTSEWRSTHFSFGNLHQRGTDTSPLSTFLGIVTIPSSLHLIAPFPYIRATILDSTHRLISNQVSILLHQLHTHSQITPIYEPNPILSVAANRLLIKPLKSPNLYPLVTVRRDHTLADVFGHNLNV